MLIYFGPKLRAIAVGNREKLPPTQKNITHTQIKKADFPKTMVA